MGLFSSKIIVTMIGLIAITVIAIDCVDVYRVNEEPTFAKNEMPVFASLEFDGQAEEYASDYGTPLGNVDIERFTLAEKHTTKEIEEYTQQVEWKIIAEDISDENTVWWQKRKGRKEEIEWMDSTRKDDRKRYEIDFCSAFIICYLINCPSY